MIARLTAWLNRAFLFTLEKLHQLGDGRLFDPETFLAGMILRTIKVPGLGRLRSRDKL